MLRIMNVIRDRRILGRNLETRGEMPWAGNTRAAVFTKSRRAMRAASVDAPVVDPLSREQKVAKM